jgi:hypothetical protein
VLRAYAIPCGTIGDGPLTPDEEAALTCLIDATSTRVTLVLSRSELAALAAAIGRMASSLNKDRLTERVLQDRANDGPGIKIVETTMKVGARGRTVAGFLEAHRVDAVLKAIGGGKQSVASEASSFTCGVADAARDVRSMPVELGLSKVSREAELASLFRPFFRFGEEVVIVDPYLAVETLRAAKGGNSNDEGLRFVVSAAADSVQAQRSSLRVQAVCCHGKLIRELRKQREVVGNSGSVNSERINKHAELLKVAQILKERIAAYAMQRGLREPQIQVDVRWVRQTSDRGLISSRRVWRVEHSLQSLAELLVSIRNGKRRSGSSARLQILQDDGAAEIHRLACEAVSIPLWSNEFA